MSKKVVEMVGLCMERIGSAAFEMPDGCPNCGFLAINQPEYDTCPFCGWGPETKPEKTAKEAQDEFLNRAFIIGNPDDWYE